MPTATSSLTVRKLLPCPPAQAFEAWTKPEQFEQWFEPQSGMRVKAKIDLRVGGKYRLGFVPPDGSGTMFVGGEYLVVDPPRRLEYTWLFGKGFERDMKDHTIVKLEFKPVGKNRTELVLKHERFSAPEVRDSHREGWTNILACMAKAMAARNKPAARPAAKTAGSRAGRKPGAR
jgi:uncharacterized protein YndB with AHSA1/START domain